nr:unnamed protein product [Digitaria exilis]
MAAGIPMPLHLILSFPFLIITVVYLVRSARRPGCATASSSSLRRLPPGPWALPVMGHLHHLMLDALPHHKLRDLSRHHGPVMLLRLGELPVVVVSSVDAAREVMKTNDLTFATLALAHGAEGLIFSPYDHTWRNLRRICTVELLSARRVRSFHAIREQEANSLLREVAAVAVAVR